jgi:dolichol-phosphate mannosyltransferase
MSSPGRGLLVVVNYNQEQEIEAVLARLSTAWPREQIVVVDDGSKDRSPQMAKTRGFEVLSHERNQGVGAAIRSGIRLAVQRGFDYVCIFSSNGKMRTEDLPAICEPVARGEADYTTGSRFLPGGGSPGLTQFRRFSIPVFSLLMSLLLGRYFSDITCGFRAYRLDWLKDPRVQLDQTWLDRYELEYYVHYWAVKLGLRIQQVPVVIPYTHLKKGRKSKIVPFVGWWSMIRPIVLLRLGIRK